MSQITFKRDDGTEVVLTATVTADRIVYPESETWDALTSREHDRAIDLMPADREPNRRHYVVFTVPVDGDLADVQSVAEKALTDGVLHSAFVEHDTDAGPLRVGVVRFEVRS